MSRQWPAPRRWCLALETGWRKRVRTSKLSLLCMVCVKYCKSSAGGGRPLVTRISSWSRFKLTNSRSFHPCQSGQHLMVTRRKSGDLGPKTGSMSSAIGLYSLSETGTGRPRPVPQEASLASLSQSPRAYLAPALHERGAAQRGVGEVQQLQQLRLRQRHDGLRRTLRRTSCPVSRGASWSGLLPKHPGCGPLRNWG
jgi:hypothetical protein